MAQSMSFPLLQRSNDPISIFAKETHVSTKSKPQTKTPTETPQTIDQLNHETELEQIQAERKALAARIKELKAARKAERLQARETELSNVLVTRLTGRVRSHIKAGETTEQALDAVFAQYREAVIAALTQPADADATDA